MPKMIAKHPVSWAITALTILSAVVALFVLGSDTTVPVHWDISGEVDGTMPAFPGLFIAPFVQIVTLLLITNLHLIEPRKEHLKNAQGFLTILCIAISFLFAATQAQILMAIWGYEGSVSLIFVGVGVLLAIVGNYMGKLQSTFTVGIRTPWTLSDEEIWRKTHRLGGKLFVVSGISVIASSFIGEPLTNFIVLTAMVLPASIIPVVYSWYLWKSQQTK